MLIGGMILVLSAIGNADLGNYKTTLVELILGLILLVTTYVRYTERKQPKVYGTWEVEREVSEIDL